MDFYASHSHLKSREILRKFLVVGAVKLHCQISPGQELYQELGGYRKLN